MDYCEQKELEILQKIDELRERIAVLESKNTKYVRMGNTPLMLDSERIDDNFKPF